jgi:hypothetical protein
MTKNLKSGKLVPVTGFELITATENQTRILLSSSTITDRGVGVVITDTRRKWVTWCHKFWDVRVKYGLVEIHGNSLRARTSGL